MITRKVEEIEKRDKGYDTLKYAKRLKLFVLCVYFVVAKALERYLKSIGPAIYSVEAIIVATTLPVDWL
jgi:hypothetical protein